MKRLFILCVFVLAATGAIFHFLKANNPSFPVLEPGTYVGKVSGEVFEDGAPKTFYLKKYPDMLTAFVTVFDSSWQAKEIRFQALLHEASSGASAVLEFEPLVLRQDGKTLSFSGLENNGQYLGQAKSNSGLLSNWSLQLVSLEEQDELPKEFRLWLRDRVKHQKFQQSLSRMSHELREKENEYYRLKKTLDNKDALVEKAEKQKEDLRLERDRLKQEREKFRGEVRDLVRELDLIKRISKKGKAIELSRRVAAREAKWYEANWGTKEDEVDLEILQGVEGIDLSDLERRFKEAQEKQILQAEISRLEEELSQINSDAAEPEDRNARKEDFWNKLWGR